MVKLSHWNILLKSKVALHNFQRLSNMEANEIQAIHPFQFFTLYKSMCSDTAIIELAKVITDVRTQRTNYHKIANRICREKYHNDLKNILKKNRMEGRNSTFKFKYDAVAAMKTIYDGFEHHRESIEKLKTIRDKGKAHSEIEPEEATIFMNELHGLQSFAEECYGIIFIGFFAFEITGMQMIEHFTIDPVIQHMTQIIQA